MAANGPPREDDEQLLPELVPSDAKHLRETHDGVHAEVRDGEVYLRSKRKVGAIGVPSGASFYIRPKVDCSLLHMLAFSERLIEQVVLDSEEASFEIGDSFVDLMANMFIHELQRIFKRGLEQQYQTEQDRLRQLRGRLDLQKQLQEGPGTTTFACEFDELTHDTPANQLLYHAADTLSTVVESDAIAGQLQRYRRQLAGAFEPQPLPRNPGSGVEFSRLNRYYKRGIELARFIHQTQYVQGFAGTTQDLSSFVVDMPSTFEEAVFERLRTVVSSTQFRVTKDDLGRLATDPQTAATRDLKPDFIIRDRASGTPLLVGDVKWKASDGIDRNDLYQLFAYQTTAQTPGLLIYPDAGQQLPAQYEFETLDSEQSLHTFKLNVADNGYETTKQRVDTDLRQVLTPFMQHSGPSSGAVSTESSLQK